MPVKSYTASGFVPTQPRTGNQPASIFRGQNFWLYLILCPSKLFFLSITFVLLNSFAFATIPMYTAFSTLPHSILRCIQMTVLAHCRMYLPYARRSPLPFGIYDRFIVGTDTAVTSLSVFSFYNIVWCQRVSQRAMSFSRIYGGRAFASCIVDCRSHGFNVRGIYAMPNFTQMVTLKSIWNSFHKNLIDNSVRATAYLRKRKTAISAFGMNVSLPFPTGHAFVKVFGRYLNFRKDACKQFALSADSIRIGFRHFILLYRMMCLGLLERCKLSCEPFSL
jgi:hypothetical protein